MKQTVNSIVAFLKERGVPAGSPLWSRAYFKFREAGDLSDEEKMVAADYEYDSRRDQKAMDDADEKDRQKQSKYKPPAPSVKSQKTESEIETREVEVFTRTGDWVSLGLQPVKLVRGEWFLADRDKIVDPAGTEIPRADGYRFASRTQTESEEAAMTEAESLTDWLRSTKDPRFTSGEYREYFENPLTREQRVIKITGNVVRGSLMNPAKGFVIRVYTADGDVYDIQRTKDSSDLEARWRHIERRLRTSGFVPSEEAEAIRAKRKAQRDSQTEAEETPELYQSIGDKFRRAMQKVKGQQEAVGESRVFSKEDSPFRASFEAAVIRAWKTQDAGLATRIMELLNRRFGFNYSQSVTEIVDVLSFLDVDGRDWEGLLSEYVEESSKGSPMREAFWIQSVENPAMKVAITDFGRKFVVSGAELHGSRKNFTLKSGCESEEQAISIAKDLAFDLTGYVGEWRVVEETVKTSPQIQESSYLVVSPAAGRDYKSAAAVKADWEAGKDFIIQSVGRWMGSYINKQDAENSGIHSVNIRYDSMRKVVVINLSKKKTESTKSRLFEVERCNSPATWLFPNGYRSCDKHLKDAPSNIPPEKLASPRPQDLCDYPLDGKGAQSFKRREEAQRVTPALGFDFMDAPSKPGAFKVGTMGKDFFDEFRDYGDVLFPTEKDAIALTPRLQLPRVLGFPETQQGISDAQDFLANRPKEAFRKFLELSRNEKYGRMIRSKSELASLYFYVYMAALSGKDMAKIIFDKYFLADVNKSWKKHLRKRLLPLPQLPTTESVTQELTLALLREIVRTHSYKEVLYKGDKVIIDVQTANVLVKIHDALKPENQAKFDAMLKTKLYGLIELAWKSVK